LRIHTRRLKTFGATIRKKKDKLFGCGRHVRRKRKDLKAPTRPRWEALLKRFLVPTLTKVKRIRQGKRPLPKNL